jgi:putative ABC transport system permease protein
LLRNYLKVAVKVLLRRKFFTFISLFGISLTLLVLLVATALLDQVFAVKAPEVLGHRTLGVYRMALKGPESTYQDAAGYRSVERLLRPMAELEAVETVAVFTTPETAVSYLNGKKIESELKRTDGEFWRVLRFEFLEGGPFSAADDENGRRLAVINTSTREKFFGGGPALGKPIELDGQRFEVVGVVANVPYLRLASYADVWVPISAANSEAYKNELIGNFRALIVARGREDFPQIKAELQSRLDAAKELIDDPQYDRLTGGADTPFEAAARFYARGADTGAGRLLAVALLGLAAFLLLPTVNLVNINLSRILDRSSEIGVRRAFGASSANLIGQFLVENLVLTLAGGAIGLLLGAAALQAINKSEIIAHAQLAINYRVFLAALATAIFFGLLSGVYPAYRMSKLNPVEALQGKAS